MNQNKYETLPLYWRDNFFQQFESNFLVTQGDISITWWHHGKNEIVSGFHGPFGGLQKNMDSPSDISVDEVKNNLISLREIYPFSKSVENLRIRTYPEGIFTKWSTGQGLALSQFGFKEQFRDVIHYIEIGGDFKSAWNRNRTREYKKTNLYLVVKEVSSEKDQITILKLLEKDASSKGRSFPLDSRRFKLMRRHLTYEELNLFVCLEKQSGAIVAAAISQVMDRLSVYVYRWGTLPTYNNLKSSPITYLANHLYEFYQNLGMEILYLGSSSVNGIVNPGLTSFKESLGAKSGSNCVYMLKSNEAFSRALS